MSMSRRKVIKAGGAGAVLAALEPSLARAGETARMPALFVSHGTPLYAIVENEFTDGWARLGRELPRPKAILSLSAHWLTRGGVYVTGDPEPPVIYDMRGFPEELYQVQYPAPGEPALAKDIAGRLSVPALTNDDWGYDHGTWSVLKYMYPEADIPVIQLSIDYAMAPAQHLALGRELAFLRERGVLILGSGQFVHNLRMMAGRTEKVAFPWALEFSETVGAWVDQRDFERVADFRSLGQLAALAHPTWDHFLPLLTVLGTADDKDGLRWVNEGIMAGSMDMKSLVVGEQVS